MKQAVLGAGKISYSTGPSGDHLKRLFEKWNIAERIADRTVEAKPGIPVGSDVYKRQVRLTGVPSFVREGMTADVEIVTNVRRHVLVVDPAAVRCETASCPMVFAVRDNLAVPTPVTVGPMNQTQAIIRSGRIQDVEDLSLIHI